MITKKIKPFKNQIIFSILIFTSVKYMQPLFFLPRIESIEIDEKKAIAIADTSYSMHDVHFLQMMILHHTGIIF